MAIAVTGASGQLGRLVVKRLLDDRHVRPAELVAVTRDPAKAHEVEAAGVTVRQGTFDDVDAMRAAFLGATTVLIVSGTDVGRRVEQHANAIDAAIQAGAQRVVYTSVARALEATVSPLARDHAQTEEYLAETGVDFTVLRNGFYTENYLDQARQAASTGELVTSAGDGLTASATRDDYAAAAAAVLTSNGHVGRRYELGGDAAWTMDDLGDAIEAVTGRPVAVRKVDAGTHLETLLGAGVKRPWAEMAVGIDQAVAAGEYGAITHELSRLAGRPTTSLEDGLRAALA